MYITFADTKTMRQWFLKQEAHEVEGMQSIITCDFTFLTGRTDKEVSRSFRDWQGIIGGVSQAVFFPGGHYFLFEFDERDDMSIAEECGRILTRSLNV
jgi:surfactin synthase thioesterase subunit